MSARFLLDANIFIAAKNKYYSFDLCPGFWDALADGHARERVYSIDRVHDELRRGDDDLVEWVKTLPDTFFVPCGDAASQYAALQQRVASSNQFTQGAKEEFARVADGWLLAKAQASGFTVVTEEVYSQDVKRRVLIPNVCRDLRLHYINTFSMLRTLDTAFVLKR